MIAYNSHNTIQSTELLPGAQVRVLRQREDGRVEAIYEFCEVVSERIGGEYFLYKLKETRLL